MADKRSMIQTLNEFSQKIQALSQGAEVSIYEKTSDSSRLQAQINQHEEDRQKYLKSRLAEYFNPLTQDVEQDEENLMKAYQLFLKIQEINKTDGDSATHLKSYLLTSPLCRKAEYTAEHSENFSLLRFWFAVNNPETAFVPEIVEMENTPGTFALDFIDIDMWQQTSFEKEIINIQL